MQFNKVQLDHEKGNKNTTFTILYGHIFPWLHCKIQDHLQPWAHAPTQTLRELNATHFIAPSFNNSCAKDKGNWSNLQKRNSNCLEKYQSYDLTLMVCIFIYFLSANFNNRVLIADPVAFQCAYIGCWFFRWSNVGNTSAFYLRLCHWIYRKNLSILAMVIHVSCYMKIINYANPGSITNKNSCFSPSQPI